jgi:tRNA/rRNA methyltransferase
VSAGRGSSGTPPPAIILVRPQEEGNVGAVARAMANFGLERLILVEPATPLRGIARAFAVHAEELLDRAERVSSLREAIAGFGRIVATTAARDRPWPQRLTVPRELPAALAGDPPGTATAIVFGPEPSGLTNQELALASLLVRVPTAPVQPTLNLGQAVVIVAYELFAARTFGLASSLAAPAAEPAHTLADSPLSVTEPRATGEEVSGFFDQLAELLHQVRFARDKTTANVERDLRQLIARAQPTRREVTILRGILRRLGHALDRSGGRAPRGRRTSGSSDPG